MNWQNDRVPRSLRHRWLIVYLGVFALIGQLLLPTLHAQAMAQRMSNPLYAAFCGEVAPQRLGALQAQLQASLQRDDEDAARNDHPLKSGCPLCAGLHAAQLVTPSTVGLPPLLRMASIGHVVSDVARITPVRVHLPPSQGPPKFS